ncbi:MAG: hypothetical protein P1U56_08055 [Saprospiraceae bacterium]|nr:hypothetical protein [Saprospiraceae bacterium]
MKFKYLYEIMMAFLLAFTIYACNSDLSLTDGDQALEETGDIAPVLKIKYCKYNVTKSSAEGLSKGDIACTPCPASGTCSDSKTAYPVQYPLGDTIGYFDGDLVNSDGKCKKCPSDGYITN